MFEAISPLVQEFNAVRRAVECRMETGNFGDARTILGEYTEINPAGAEVLRTQIIAAYGTSL